MITSSKPFPRNYQYGVIYADPPWKYTMRSEKGYAKSPEAHYDTMAFDAMAAMRDDILFASSPDCVLFMWTTWPAHPESNTDLLQQSLDLMKLWGFQRKTGGCWNKTTANGKQHFGTGYIMRGASEPFIIGTRGNPKIKNKSTRNSIFTGDVPDNFNDLGITITAKARDHSQKPDEMTVLLENLFDGPYLELFSRTERPNWTVWGNETDKYGVANG